LNKYNIKQIGASMSNKDYKQMSDSEKKKEDWMNSKWRPMMGWMYMAVCMTDFVLFPVLWSLVQAVHGGSVQTQWSPITLQGAGLFHMAMGAILGIAAFGRTQEKLQGANNGGLTQHGGFGSQSMGGGYGSAPVNNGYGSFPSSSNNMNTVGYGSPTAGSFGGISAGKARPAEPDYPVL
jgi:hypothetical protein